MKKVFCLVILLSAYVFTIPALYAQQPTRTDSTNIRNAMDVYDSLNKSPYYYALRQRFYKGPEDTLRIDKFGFTVKPSITFGAGLRMRRHKDKDPYAYEHSLIAYYAINRAGLAIEHQSQWNQVVGNWGLSITNRLDIPRSVYFFGVGNESVKREDIKRKYYRLFSTEFFSSVGINHLSKNNAHFFEVSPFYQQVNINLGDDDFISDYLPNLKGQDVERKHFMGATTTYGYTKRNDELSPTKGFIFNATANYTKNVKSTDQTDADFFRYTSYATVYLPISRVITLAVRAGGALIDGDPEFYQLNRLGGNETLRGFRRERFYGERSFYNNNDLRVLWPTRNNFFDGKIGFVAFVDQGRVWQPGEESDTWHVGYGGGPVVQIFNQLLLNASYGISKEDRVLHLRLGFLF
jgi:hypothetical protein